MWGFLQEDELSIKNLAIGNFDSAKKLNKHQQVELIIICQHSHIVLLGHDFHREFLVDGSRSHLRFGWRNAVWFCSR